MIELNHTERTLEIAHNRPPRNDEDGLALSCAMQKAVNKTGTGYTDEDVLNVSIANGERMLEISLRTAEMQALRDYLNAILAEQA